MTPFTPDEIGDVFPIIEPIINRLYLDFGGYSPEKIRHLLEIQAATLHIADGESFFIAQWSETTCHILAAASLSGHVKDFNQIISDTTIFFKQLGCSKITFTSPREGWGRVASRIGFHVESITYAKEV
ncbi:hypothetical protein HC000_02005 [Pseudoalteromonas sp. MIP2626]|uniref:hypothetical protein n=1 Tax=Pseudoalteromonas sp. MIP2626 TaxID=2705464 RepID=UPI0015C92F4A|nr:hypothetical protein [Pseudoalteromonas sp. MIP2626]NYR11273.1 hypothetical protein [Pseudoalteromonas sp. MIP2626]